MKKEEIPQINNLPVYIKESKKEKKPKPKDS